MLRWQCESYHALPDAGGLFDQDAALMYRLDVLGNVYHTLSRFRAMQGAEIHRLTDPQRLVLRWLRDQGLI